MNKDIGIKLQPYVRKCTVDIKHVEDTLKNLVCSNLNQSKQNTKLTTIIMGEKINALSDRYKTFFTKGYKCVTCGIQGEYFALEKDAISKTNKYHLNLYAKDKSGEEVLMTKDHILPKSKGGKCIVDNYQTMCTICNFNKGNSII